MTDNNLSLKSILPEAPEEIKPVVGTLHYGNTARAKLLISDLVSYIVRELQEPSPYPALAMTEGKAREILSCLNTFLTSHGYYPQLGPDVQQLVQTARRVRFSEEGWQHLEEKAQKIGGAPEVQQAFDSYMDARQAGQLTCFFCDKPVDEGGADSSTEFGVFFGCDEDWRVFGNPDQYI